MFLDIVKLESGSFRRSRKAGFMLPKTGCILTTSLFCAISPASSCRACTSRYLPGKYSERRSSELCAIAVIVRQSRNDWISPASSCRACTSRYLPGKRASTASGEAASCAYCSDREAESKGSDTLFYRKVRFWKDSSPFGNTMRRDRYVSD